MCQAHRLHSAPGRHLDNKSIALMSFFWPQCSEVALLVTASLSNRTFWIACAAPQREQSRTWTPRCVGFLPRGLRPPLPSLKCAMVRAGTWVTRDGCRCPGQGTPREPGHHLLSHSGWHVLVAYLHPQIPAWVLFCLYSYLETPPQLAESL